MNAPISTPEGPLSQQNVSDGAISSGSGTTLEPGFFIEHSQWCNDITSWKREQEKAVVLLKQLDEILEQHGRVLETRSVEINDLDQLRGSRAVQRGRQHRVERQHRVLMAHLAMMKSVIDSLG